MHLLQSFSCIKSKCDLLYGTNKRPRSLCSIGYNSLTIGLSAFIIINNAVFSFFCRFFAFYPLDEFDRGLLDCSCYASIRCLETSSFHENQGVGKNAHVWKFSCFHAYFCALHVLGNKRVLHWNGNGIVCCYAYACSDRSSLQIQHSAEFKKVH